LSLIKAFAPQSSSSILSADQQTAVRPAVKKVGEKGQKVREKGQKTDGQKSAHKYYVFRNLNSFASCE
jgi:hypothetical protein